MDHAKIREREVQTMIKNANQEGPAEVLQRLQALHEEISERADQLESQHANRLLCKKGCASCCTDSLTVFEIEAALIQSLKGEMLQHEQPSPAGRCAFLDPNDACRIYDVRPYVCRTQGLPLRWLELEEDEWYEYRDICPLNEEGAPPEELEEDECWTIGPFESQLATLQQTFKGSLERVALRDLFLQKNQDDPFKTQSWSV